MEPGPGLLFAGLFVESALFWLSRLSRVSDLPDKAIA